MNIDTAKTILEFAGWEVSIRDGDLCANREGWGILIENRNDLDPAGWYADLYHPEAIPVNGEIIEVSFEAAFTALLRQRVLSSSVAVLCGLPYPEIPR